MSTIVPLSAITDNAADVLQSVGNRVTLPDTSALRDDVAGSLSSLGEVIVPTTTVAVGAGTRAAVAGGRTVRRHPVLVIGGAFALVAAILWLTKRSKDTSAARNGAGRFDERNAA